MQGSHFNRSVGLKGGRWLLLFCLLPLAVACSGDYSGEADPVAGAGPSRSVSRGPSEGCAGTKLIDALSRLSGERTPRKKKKVMMVQFQEEISIYF